MTEASGYHEPVMVQEVLSVLQPERGGVYLDGTLGGGGHSAALLESSTVARVIGVDRDPDAIRQASERLSGYGERFQAIQANFADAVTAAQVEEGSLAGVLLDLGISSHQIDVTERGFTFRSGAPLDMRMAQGTMGERSAADLLNSLEEEELATLFFRYGEERRSRKLARIVVQMREEAPFETSDRLVEAVERTVPRATIQDRARIFQALRIAVNEELDALERALLNLRDALQQDGVFAILAYHSLEDRLVKDSFREWSRDCVCPPALPVCRCRGVALGETLTRKPLVASEAEVAANPRARSARLRAWRRG